MNAHNFRLDRTMPISEMSAKDAEESLQQTLGLMRFMSYDQEVRDRKAALINHLANLKQAA